MISSMLAQRHAGRFCKNVLLLGQIQIPEACSRAGSIRPGDDIEGEVRVEQWREQFYSHDGDILACLPALVRKQINSHLPRTQDDALAALCMHTRPWIIKDRLENSLCACNRKR
jgi:hypothetical protein